VDVRVGTFNLNNLFSRFNFRAEIDEIPAGMTASYTFADPERVRVRTYRGRLVQGKSEEARARIARRLLGSDLAESQQVDVWAVQEVEDIDTLRFFAAQELRGRYPHVVLVEGNDPRLIDLAVLSRLPLGGVTSWQHAVHPAAPQERVFGRDLLEVEILDPRRRRRLFTLFNNHLKSHFVPFDEDQVAGERAAEERRRRQAETVAEIVRARTRPGSRYVLCGDMNDPPGAAALRPFTDAADLGLVDGLAAPAETRPPPRDDPPPASTAWTHRFKPSRRPARYELLDHLWLSPAMADRQEDAWIDRRTRLTGDGSDHDPAWVTLRL
jgi:exonuclease III